MHGVMLPWRLVHDICGSSCQPAGAYNFKMALRFFGNFVHPWPKVICVLCVRVNSILFYLARVGHKFDLGVLHNDYIRNGHNCSDLARLGLYTFCAVSVRR